MSEGANGQFVVKNQTLESFVGVYQKVLLELGFNIEDSIWGDKGLRHKAVLGNKAKAFAPSHFVPAGELMDSANRYGAEAEISKWGSDILFKVCVIPYMSLMDMQDEVIVTQGLFEMKLDDARCLARLKYIINGLVYYGVEIYVLDTKMFPLPHQKQGQQPEPHLTP